MIVRHLRDAPSFGGDRIVPSLRLSSLGSSWSAARWANPLGRHDLHSRLTDTQLGGDANRVMLASTSPAGQKLFTGEGRVVLVTGLAGPKLSGSSQFH